ncbi:MAG: DUF2892 domain-containing protein [Bacteroidales bacterium]|nr:DUF2892 domain-containing protein [Bacteroidales bacterium]
MEKNMGTIDKTIRIIIGFVIFGLYFADIITGTLAIILIILAGIFLLTSVFSFCPLYVPFGINTCKKK